MASGIASFLGGFSGASIGTAVVNLFTDTKGYNAGLDQADAKLKGFSTNAGASMSKFGALSIAAWAAAGTAIIAFGKSAVDAALDHEEAMATLRNAVGGNTEALEEQASALQLLTGVSDEEIIRAEAMLSRFQLTKTEMQSTIPVILDYARATGKDLGSATESVGKALLGNTRALKAVGADFKITGNRATDLAALMELLKERTGGASTELSESEKNMITLSVAADEFKESMGALIVDAIGPMVKKVGELVTAFEGLASSFGGEGGGGGVLGASIDFLTSKFNPLVLSIDYTTWSLRQLDGAVGGITPTVTEAAEGPAHLAKIMDKLGIQTEDTRKDLETFAGKVGKELKEFRAGIKDDFAVAGEAVGGFKAKFEVTVRAFARGLHNMQVRLRQQIEDLKEFNDVKMGDRVRQFFLEQGPDAIHAFAEASKEGQRGFVDDAKKIAEQQKIMGEEIDRGTGKAKDLKKSLGDLDGQKSHAVVSVKYELDTSGLNPKQDLPGLAAP